MNARYLVVILLISISAGCGYIGPHPKTDWEHSVILTVLMVVSERLQWGWAVFVGKVSIFNGFRYFGSPEGLGINLWDLLQKTAQNRSSGGF